MPKKKIIRPKKRINTPKKCVFCEERTQPAFTDTKTLTPFLTERGKIVNRSRNGLCAKHQKNLTEEVKRARHLALISYTARE